MEKYFFVDKELNDFCTNILSQEQSISLKFLYQPIIGHLSTSLYQILHDYYFFSKEHKTYFEIQELEKNLQLDFSELEKELKKLEAVGLLRTFKTIDNQYLVFKLNSPLSINKFSENKILFKCLMNKITVNMFEKISSFFQRTTFDKNNLVEKTSKFQDVFSLDVLNQVSRKKETLIFDNEIDAVKTLSNFDFFKYLTKEEPSFYQKNKLKELSFLNLNACSLNLIMEYSFKINKKIILNHVEKIATSLIEKKINNFDDIKLDLENAYKNRKYLDHTFLYDMDFALTPHNKQIEIGESVGKYEH